MFVSAEKGTIFIPSYLLAILLSMLLGGCATTVERPAPDIMIKNVTVIVGDGSQPLPNQDVTITGDRISGIRPTSSENLADTVQIIDGTDKFMLPGFIDTHAHVGLGPVSGKLVDGVPKLSVTPDPELSRVTMELLLEHGVTTVRDPGGDTKTVIGIRDAQANGELKGPRLQVAGLLIDTSEFENLVTTVRSESDIEAEIERQAAQGVDWIKLYTGLTPNLTSHAIDVAHRNGLKVTGHLDKTSWTEAASSGIDSLVHVIPGSDKYLPSESRKRYAAMRRSTLFMLRWFELVDFNSPEMKTMLHSLTENRVSIDLTLVLFHAMANGNDPHYVQADGLQRLPVDMTNNWRRLFNFNVGWTEKDYQTAQHIWPRVLEFAKLLHDNGVELTVGTDANNPWIIPGDSFHQELALLVDAGIPPMEVLTMATANGARLLGLSEDVGTVKVGKRADLLLLNTDPVANIKNSDDIAWVMQNGKLVDN